MPLSRLGITGIAFALGLWASTAGALVSFHVNATTSSGGTLDEVVPGDLVTLDIRLSNPTGTSIYGVGAAVQGYDPNIFQFVSGEAVEGPFFCTNEDCTVGLENQVTGPLTESQAIGVGAYVQFMSGISTTGRSGNGTRDPGLDGVVSGGDAQFRLVFRYAQFGLVRLDIGTHPTLGNLVVLAGGETVPGNNASLLFPVPEPGTGLLIGLGLAGLAATGRRS